MAGDGRVGAEMLEKAVTDLRPQRGARLRGAAARPGARSLERRAEAGDILPDLANPRPFERRDRTHRDLPFSERRANQPQRTRIVGSRSVCGGSEFAVRLVDEDEIGELDHPALDPLQLVARRRRQNQHEEVDDFGDRRLGLAHPDRLDQHRVESGRFAQQDRFARAARYTTPSVAGRGRPDEGLRRLRQLEHASLVAEDGTAAALRRRVDGEYGDMPAERYPFQAKAFDEGRFARTRRAGNADANRTPGLRQERLDEPFRRVAMVRAGRFDEGDGAGERPPIATSKCRDQLFGAHTLVSPWRGPLRAAPPPAGGSTYRHRHRDAAAAPDGGRARRYGQDRVRGSHRRRQPSTAGAR